MSKCSKCGALHILKRDLCDSCYVNELEQALRECYAAVDWTGSRENIRRIVAEVLEGEQENVSG